MPPQLCRNFQRGSCSYGARCKFLHSAPQQQQQQNGGGRFGFGAQSGFQQQQNGGGGSGFGGQTGFQQQQQQNTNPFGFGVKSSSQFGGGAVSGAQRDQSKPFSNQWNRNAATPASRPADGQSQSASHTCTDPQACKRMIVEDSQNERPLWKLTCYGHWRYSPCDITGDISYEELRAAAYDDARRGLSVQAIAERERSLVNSKLAEFDNFLRNPYVPQSNSSMGQTTSQGNAANSFPSAPPNASPPVVSTFGQAASLGAGFGARPSTPTIPAFGNQSSFPAGGNSSPFTMTNPNTAGFGSANNINTGGFGSASNANTGGFGSANNTNTGGFGSANNANTFGFGSANNTNTGGFGSANNANTFGFGSANNANTSGFGSANNTNTGGFGSASNTNTNTGGFSSVNNTNTGGFGSVNNTNTGGFGSMNNTNTGGFGSMNNTFATASPQDVNPASNHQVISSIQSKTTSGDASIWLKEKWDLGEIPEEAPPDEFCLEVRFP